MSVALAVWSTTVAPGEKRSVETLQDLEIRITNVALDETLADESGRTTLKISYNPAPTKLEDLDSDAGSDATEQVTTVICSLTPGKIEQASVDLVLDSDQNFIFEVSGKNTVHVTGNYILQRPNDGDSDSEDEDEGAFRLEDVSSDVEVDPAELGQLGESDDDDAGRFEEIHDEPSSTKSKKRSAEGMDVDEEKPSKAQKKAAKKQKGENGKAVPTPAEGEKKKVKDKEKGKDTEKPEKEKKEKEKKKSIDISHIPQKELAGGLKIRDVVVGDGPDVKKGQQIKMRYIGRLTDGTVFDKNTSGKPFIFQLGAGDVIKGWDQGIVGMKVGGEREIMIPPALGYGKRKAGSIPPNSTLKFEVKVVGAN